MPRYYFTEQLGERVVWNQLNQGFHLLPEQASGQGLHKPDCYCMGCWMQHRRNAKRQQQARQISQPWLPRAPKHRKDAA